MKKLGAVVAAVVMAGGLTVGASSASLAEEKQLSEKVVKYIMDHTWDFMPNEITVEGQTPEQKKVVKIDKKKREVGVKEDEAREIIMIARRSALAENCGLRELRQKNYKTLMAQKQKDKTKSLVDVVYINQMHLFTVYLWRGQVVAGSNQKAAEPKKFDCKPDQKAQVKAEIEAYLKANPILDKTAEKAK